LKANASASNFERPQGQLHRLPEFAAEMVNLGVNLIAVIGAVTVRAVRQATSTIPIVFAVVVEPIPTDWSRT
jgi:putative ABC transport system substrate-binding protein